MAVDCVDPIRLDTEVFTRSEVLSSALSIIFPRCWTGRIYTGQAANAYASAGVFIASAWCGWGVLEKPIQSPITQPACWRLSNRCRCVHGSFSVRITRSQFRFAEGSGA